ncbi:uncharacterized protein LOC131617677 isoform X2 [Vicia villosa]|uniref:uncharacterized protein LOC131617677 isoform X2 n=1 Tax=Vicia villosa TaxID=3911 RepID=UPI00273BA252|nr:uncharacterized protein LOC131617677 isoform X2 [Vicia villosa]
MKSNLFIFLYFCWLLFFFVGAIEPPKHEKQFGKTKETRASLGLDGYATYQGGVGVWNSGGSDTGGILNFPNIIKGANDNGNIIQFPGGGGKKNGGGRNRILGHKSSVGKVSMKN